MFWVYFLCIYINVDVEANPKIFLNGIYTNANKLDNYYVNSNNDEVFGLIDLRKQDAVDINECINAENRDVCLKRLTNYYLHETPLQFIRRLSKQFILGKDNNHNSSDDNERSQGYNNFSQDYLDIRDILRSDGDMKHSILIQKPKKSPIFKSLRPNKFDRFTYDLMKFRRSNKKKKAYQSDERDSSDSSASSESRETILTDKIAKNKRFQIGDETKESESSEEIRIPKKKTKKYKDNIMYMQSPFRFYEIRRRLPHFFPKRYHWNEDDVKDLTGYWFSGPQGKYGGQYS